MNRPALAAWAAGTLFGAGLVLGGMTDPRRVLAFLDVTGDFDPSLVFVMVGAVLVHATTYRWIRKRKAPWLTAQFDLPTRRDIDLKLLAGAALFGLGWGFAGYCPGPSLVALPSASSSAWVFVLAMAGGQFLAGLIEKRQRGSST